MPSLFRFLLVVGVLGGLGYAGAFRARPVSSIRSRARSTVTIPPDKLFKHR